MKMLKNVKNVVDNMQEEIIEIIVKAKKEAEGLDRSRRIDICIDEEGEIWTTGALSQNWATVSQWNNESYTITSVEGWYVGADGYDYNFNDAIQNEDNYEELEKEFEADEDFYDFYDFIEEKYPEIIEKMDEEYKEWFIEDYYQEEAIRKLDNSIEQLDNQIEYAKKYSGRE